MNAVSPSRTPGPRVALFYRIAAFCWVITSALTGPGAGAQTTADTAIDFDWAVAPEDLGPGSAFTIDGTITIDPGRVDAVAGTVRWLVTVGPMRAVTIGDASCDATAGTSCTAEVNATGDTVSFSGAVEHDPPAAVTAGIVMTGAIADRLDGDAILFEAATCGTVTVVSGTPAAGRLPAGIATPDAGARCAGAAGTIEVTVPPAIEAPTQVPTGEPSATPRTEPGSTNTSPPTPAATETGALMMTPTMEPTATVPPTATREPTTAPTEAATATLEPTAPSAPSEPAETPAVPPTAPSTEAPAPLPAPDEDEGDRKGTSTGLWVGVGSLLILTAAAGIVLYQRRKLSG